MTTPADETSWERTERLHKMLEAEGCVAFIWSIEDVKNERPDLNDEQCMDVLKQCQKRHDAEVGVNWSVLEYHAGELFPRSE